MSEKKDNVFSILNAIDANSEIEYKEGIKYISWVSAWRTVKSLFPDANYEVIKNENGMPYFEDSNGAMVFTKVTIQGQTHEMWLPVMNSINKAMKKEPYTYKTKTGEKSVEAYTSFDINKTIMRCLAKNLAMFGYGLYIYDKEEFNSAYTPPTLDEEQISAIKNLIAETESDEEKFLKFNKVKNIYELDFEKAIASLNAKKEKIAKEKLEQGQQNATTI